MRIQELADLFEKGRRRCLTVGDADAGVLIGLDLEGRLYAYHDGDVIHRVNPDAALLQSHAEEYYNPGGDGFWPAPEGSRFGYFYSTGAWRVPPGLSGARYRILSQAQNSARVTAEMDLITSAGVGMSLSFTRDVSVAREPGMLRMEATDSIAYLGSATPASSVARIAPWTLAQFDTSPGMEVVFPKVPKASICDFYEPSDELRRTESGLWHVRTEGGQRFQIGLAPGVEWIELRVPARAMRVRRTARPVSGGTYIDIADRDPDAAPGDFLTRYSVYNDATNFMEIEAAGTCPEELTPETVLTHEVVTEFVFGE